MPDFQIRPAMRQDAAIMLALLRELAGYEKLLDRFSTDEAAIGRDFFGPKPAAECDLGFAGDEPVGIVTCYWTYGSFTTARGLFIEDLFVRPAFRGRGFGKALLAHIAQKALAAGATRLDWWALDWNKPAHAFYEGLGARRIADWYPYRLEGDALKALKP
jgi:GNAT superfamily N-acetyltransferase